MPAIFPVLLEDTIAGSIKCMHGGTWVGTGATTSLMDGKAPILTTGGFSAGTTPCTGMPPQIPACQLPSPALSMATRVTIDSPAAKPVTVMIPQIATTNAMPAFIPAGKTTSVKVL